MSIDSFGGNTAAKQNFLNMYGEMPKSMLILNNSIYCVESERNIFHYAMGLNNSILDTTRIEDAIERRPYPNKDYVQLSKKANRNVCRTGYPILYDKASDLYGRKYIAFDIWLGRQSKCPQKLSTAEDTYHLFIPLDINVTDEKSFASIRLKLMFKRDCVGFYIETSEGENPNNIGLLRTNWYTDEKVMLHPVDTYDKKLLLDEASTIREQGIYVFQPITLNGFAFEHLDFMLF